MEKWESETSIWYSDENKTAYMTTFNRAMINKMDKLVKQFPTTYKMYHEIIYDKKVEGKEYTLDKKLISIRQPSKRTLTDEEKSKVGERLKKSRGK